MDDVAGYICQAVPFRRHCVLMTWRALSARPYVAYPHMPATSFATKFVHVSTNKIRTAITQCIYMPVGRSHTAPS